MITSLTIHNYALINHIEVNLNEGLTVLTGETGAGKSILLDALSLVLGKRADLSSVNDTTKKCYVEAHLDVSDYNLISVFSKNNLDYDSVTILRRELLPGGKSRAFVNDSPVTLSQLQAVSDYLIDIHNQHQTLSLFSENFQFQLLDTLSNNASVLAEFSKTRNLYLTVSKELKSISQQKIEAEKEQDYNLFLLNELQSLPLSKINQQELEEQLDTLSNAELIQQSLGQVIQILSQESLGSIETLKEAIRTLGKIKSFSKKYEELYNRLQSSFIEIEDIFRETFSEIEQVEMNPEALETINQQLQELYRLQQKHSVASIEELIEVQTQLNEKINRVESFENRIITLTNEKNRLQQEAVNLAKNISENRKKAIPKFKNQVIEILKQIGLPDARFDFKITATEEFKPNGMDSLQLLFTANKGIPFQELKKVASGGELSRIMLAIKAVLVKYKKLPTLILDEIDTGVSGEIANKMGDVMKNMSKNMQLLVITHLPQIAAKGNHHIKIFKKVKDNTTQTHLKTLNKEERILEIAEMIGGKTQTQTAITHAKELLN